ncbi:MAG: PTS transporter subunit EIIC, partial [Brooklawnia sp.]
MPHSRAFQGSGTDEVFSFISWTPFAFLPIFIAITASKHFKVNTFVAVLCCAAIMNPHWGAMAGRIADGETIRLFGIALSPTTYTSTVIPPLLLVWLLSYLERFLKKFLKGSAENLLVPLISAVVMVPLTLLIVGPLSAAGANGIANGHNWLVSVAPAVAAAIIGGFWQVAVIFGIHWGITPVVLANFEQYGYDSFQAFQTAAVIAQVGAALGVFLKTKSKQLRGVAGSAAVTGIFGITEPTIYGVTLRLKRPFILA